MWPFSYGIYTRLASAAFKNTEHVVGSETLECFLEHTDYKWQRNLPKPSCSREHLFGLAHAILTFPFAKLAY